MLKEWLESQEFYEVMQQYRHTPIIPIEGPHAAFEAVKKAILKQLSEETGGDCIRCHEPIIDNIGTTVCSTCAHEDS